MMQRAFKHFRGFSAGRSASKEDDAAAIPVSCAWPFVTSGMLERHTRQTTLILQNGGERQKISHTKIKIRIEWKFSRVSPVRIEQAGTDHSLAADAEPRLIAYI